MNLDLNIASYLIYFLFIATVILRVGRLCHNNGTVWMRSFVKDSELCTTVNRLLLLAYYLLNLGYGTYLIGTWPTINDSAQMIGELGKHLAHILLLLATLHYMNILAITLLGWYLNRTQTASKPNVTQGAQQQLRNFIQNP